MGVLRGLCPISRCFLFFGVVGEFFFFCRKKEKKLPYRNTLGKTREEQLINWAKMIYTNKEEERRMLATTSPIFKLLNEKIEEITRSPEEQRLFDARMKMRSDILGEMELNYEEGRN